MKATNIFKSARIKLTAWYLIIIMLITLFFSVLVFRGVSISTRNALYLHNLKVERRLKEHRGRNDLLGPQERFQEPLSKETISETMEEVEKKILTTLGVINLVILALSAVLGYLLAGKTLKPIEEMTEKQKKFIADAAHELKTPLTSMKTYLEVNLRKKDLKLAQSREIMQNTVEDIDSTSMLIESLLKQSRYQNYSDGNEFEQVELLTLISKAATKFGSRAEEKNVTIKVEGDEATVQGNKKALSELFNILLDNGIKFSEKNGQVNINLTKGSKNAIIRVSDKGIGIEEEDIAHIFDRFYVSSKSRSKGERDGFGLGLSIAKEIVKMHKGTISVESELKKGTTFTIRLPLSQ